MTDDANNLKKELDEAKERIRKLEGKSVNNYKSQGVTLILSILLGIIGIMGIGHFYVGKKRRGVLILIAGLFLAFALFMLTVGVSLIHPYASDSITTTTNTFFVIYLIPFIVLYVFQIIDSNRQCRLYNKKVDDTKI